jgi:hypothetical protein
MFRHQIWHRSGFLEYEPDSTFGSKRNPFVFRPFSILLSFCFSNLGALSLISYETDSQLAHIESDLISCSIISSRYRPIGYSERFWNCKSPSSISLKCADASGAMLPGDETLRHRQEGQPGNAAAGWAVARWSVSHSLDAGGSCRWPRIGASLWLVKKFLHGLTTQALIHRTHKNSPNFRKIGL